MPTRGEPFDLPLYLIGEQKLRLDSSRVPNELTESFLLHGQLSPVLVRPREDKSGKYELVFGNRRFAAAMKLGWKTIKAQVVNVSEAEALILAFAENSDREDFTDFERALLLEKIHETTGKMYKEIAELIGRSQAFVTQHVAMLHLFPEECASEKERQHVLSSLTEWHARILARVEDPIDRWNTAKLCVASNMGVRELARICSHKRRSDSSISDPDGPKNVPELIKNILKGTTSKDIRPFSNAVCSKHFTMFSSFRMARRMCYEEALDHIAYTVAKTEVWTQQIEDLEIRTTGNVSFATLMIKHRIKKKDATSFIRARTRVTFVFEKEAGIWKCTHGHWSSFDPSEKIPLNSAQ